MHWHARSLLPSLYDGALPGQRAARVRRHLGRCESCRRTWRSFEASDRLLRMLPIAVVPRDPSPTSQVRLVALARWASSAKALAPAARATGLGALAAAAGFALALTLSPVSRGDADHSGQDFMLAVALMPDTSLMPTRFQAFR